MLKNEFLSHFYNYDCDPLRIIQTSLLLLKQIFGGVTDWHQSPGYREPGVFSKHWTITTLYKWTGYTTPPRALHAYLTTTFD